MSTRALNLDTYRNMLLAEQVQIGVPCSLSAFCLARKYLRRVTALQEVS
jgi:hypothetical protein